MIPITTVRFGPEEEALVLEVLRSGQVAQGAYVERFEREFASLHNVDHAVAVNNGTTALVVAMEALGVGPGDEVITSPFTFVATLNAILEAGATARFADIGPDFNVDPGNLASLVNERTRALMPVHLYGYMADMDPIMAVAARARPARGRGCRSSCRRVLSRPSGRQLRRRVLLALRDQEPDDGRGRNGHDQR